MKKNRAPTRLIIEEGTVKQVSAYHMDIFFKILCWSGEHINKFMSHEL
jgi:hypothetical protein